MNEEVTHLHALGVDVSMILLRLTNNFLVTKEIARQLAEMVILDQFGEAEAATQRPLRISDGGDRWDIKGASDPSQSDERANFVDEPVEMAISKVDGQILKFFRARSLRSPLSLDELNALSPEQARKLSDM